MPRRKKQIELWALKEGLSTYAAEQLQKLLYRRLRQSENAARGEPWPVETYGGVADEKDALDAKNPSLAWAEAERATIGKIRELLATYALEYDPSIEPAGTITRDGSPLSDIPFHRWWTGMTARHATLLARALGGTAQEHRDEWSVRFTRADGKFVVLALTGADVYESAEAYKEGCGHTFGSHDSDYALDRRAEPESFNWEADL